MQTNPMPDERRLPFFIVTKTASSVLSECFAGRRLPVARSIYFAIVELSNDARSTSFTKPRKAIAERAGVNVRVVDEYVPELEAAGLLRVERVFVEGVNLPNRWTLTDPHPRARTGGSDPADTTPGDPADATPGDPADAPIQEPPTTTSSVVKEGEEARGRAALSLVGSSSPEVVKAKPVSYRGRRVPADVVANGERLCAVFAEATGRACAARTGRGDATPALKQILGALLVHEGVAPDEWEDAVRATVASPPSWVDGPVQIGHVFGERAAAHALAAGRGERRQPTGRRAENDALVEGLRREAGLTA